MNISIEFKCDIKVLKPTKGVYCKETKDGWFHSHPDKYSIDPTSFMRIVRKFLDKVYFSDEFVNFIAVIKAKTDKCFGERFVDDIEVRDLGEGNFFHAMDIEYDIRVAITKILKKFKYEENFKADITIDLKSN